VKRVIEDGPADKAGFKVGDVIIKFNGERVHIVDDLMQMLTGLEPGQSIPVEVQRGEEIVKLKIILRKKKKD
jgi:serine protease Do